MSKNKNGMEKLTNETEVPEELRQKLVERLVKNYKTKGVRAKQNTWGINFQGLDRKDGRLRVVFEAEYEDPCACGLGCELGGQFIKAASDDRQEIDLAAIRLRRKGFPVTKAFCEGFIGGFDKGHRAENFVDFSTQYKAGRQTGAEVWERCKAEGLNQA